MDINSKPKLPGQPEQPSVSEQQTLKQSDLQIQQQVVPTSTSKHPDFWNRFRKGELYEDELYDIFKPYARYLKIILQMLVAVIVTVLIILAGLHTLGIPISFVPVALLTTKPLEIISVALAFSTAFELAYTLFTPGPDVGPLYYDSKRNIPITGSTRKVKIEKPLNH